MAAEEQPLKRKVSFGVGAIPTERGGFRVEMVQRFGSAAKAGIKKGDELFTIDGQKIIGPETITSRTEAVGTGGIVKVGLEREGKPIELDVKLRARLELDIDEFDEDLESNLSPFAA